MSHYPTSRLFSSLAALTLTLAIVPACGSDSAEAGDDVGATDTTEDTSDNPTTDDTTTEDSTTDDSTTDSPTTDDTTTDDPTTDTTDTADTTTDTTDTTETTTDTSMDLSFEADVFPIIQASCSCHVVGSGGLTMSDAATAYDNLVSVPAVHDPTINRVEPGDHLNSFIYQKVTGTQDGISAANAQMPKSPGQAMSLNPLAADEIQLIADWIDAGALP